MNFICEYCDKQFANNSNLRRHVKTCQTKNEINSENEVMSRFIKQFIEMKKEMIKNTQKISILEDEVNAIKEENKELRAQMLQLATKQPSLVNQGTIINGDQNNYHIQVNINMEQKPLNFGHETTDHISKKTIQRLIDKYGFSKVITNIVQRIYNDPKFPMNMTIKLCPCNDLMCFVVAVHMEDEWRKKSIDDIAKLVYRKISDYLSQVTPEELYKEGTKINKFDNELCEAEISKNFDVKAIKSGLISKEIQCD